VKKIKRYFLRRSSKCRWLQRTQQFATTNAVEAGWRSVLIWYARVGLIMQTKTSVINRADTNFGSTACKTVTFDVP
ncbi:MAG: hypothetical protein ACLP2X_01200, partial [Syntrophobacteraceae bacterium]